MAGALDGIKVLDLTTIYSGPLCTTILGDQGADVIKIETAEGDWMRSALVNARNGVGGAFAMLNRNKRSMVLDLREDEGKAVFRKMVGEADVVVENFRPGVMERLGVDYDTLKEINPKLIFCSINGVGHTGPYASRRVYDAIVQAISGMATLQSNPAKERPVMINTLICDKLTSLIAAQSISSALVARERSGIGQRVDVAMLESSLFFLWSDNLQPYTFVGDEKSHEVYETHTNMVRETKDGHICTMPVQLDEWLGTFRALGLPNLLEDPEFMSEEGVRAEVFQAALNERFKEFPTAQIAQNLEREEVPYSLINARDDVINDPQVKALDALWEFEHPFAGPMRQARPPGRFSETPSEIFRCSPELGEHSEDVLAEFGWSEDDIRDLKERKIIS